MMIQKTIPPRAWAEMMLLAAIWGGSFLSNRVALDEVPVLTLVALRVSLGGALLWVYVLAKGLTLPRGALIWLGFLGMGLLNNAIPFTLIVWGQLAVPSGLAAIVNASTAIFSVLLAALFFADERLTPHRLAGVILGFAGVAVAIGASALLRLDLGSLPQLALVGASVSYACAKVFARGTATGLPPQVAAAGMLTGASALMLPLALWVDGVPAFGYGAKAWGAIAYLACAATAGAYVLYYRVLGMAGAGNLGLVTLLVAPFAIVLGGVVLGEVLPLRAYAGFALISVGLLILDGRLARRRNSA